MRQWTIDAFAARPSAATRPACVEPLAAWPDDGLDAGAGGREQPGRDRLPAEDRRPGPASACAGSPRRWRCRSAATPPWPPAMCCCRELGVAAGQGHLRHPVRAARPCARRDAGYEMDFPAQPPTAHRPPPGLAEALGVEPAEVWAAAYLVAILKDEAVVRGLHARPRRASSRSPAGATGGRGNVGVAALADAGRRL